MTWWTLNGIMSWSYDILSLITSSWHLYNDNLTLCIWLVIYMIYFVSMSFCTIINVCFVCLDLFMLGDSRRPIGSRVHVLPDCDLPNTLLWWILGLCLSFIIFFVICLRTSELEVIFFSLTSNSVWVLLRSTSSSKSSWILIDSPLNRQKPYLALVSSEYLTKCFL